MQADEFDKWCETVAPGVPPAALLLPRRKEPLVGLLLWLVFLGWLLYLHFRKVPDTQSAYSTDDVVRDVFTDETEQPVLPHILAGTDVASDTEPKELDAALPEAGMPPADEEMAASSGEGRGDISRSSANREDIIRSHRESLLQHLESKSEEHDRNLTRRLATAEDVHSFTMMGLRIAAVSTLVLAVVGVLFVFATLETPAAISGALAILPGSGTAIFWRLATASDKKIQVLSKDHENAVKLLRAIQAAFLISDTTKRDAAITRLANQLAERA